MEDPRFNTDLRPHNFKFSVSSQIIHEDVKNIKKIKKKLSTHNNQKSSIVQ